MRLRALHYFKLALVESSIFPRGVEIVAAALIRNSQGKILLVKSPKWRERFVLPGGHVNPGESLAEAAKREGEEETGLKLRPLFCINVGERIGSKEFNRPSHLVYFHFLCDALSSDEKPQADEVLSIHWFDPSEALSLPLVFGLKETIQNYINGVQIPLIVK